MEISPAALHMAFQISKSANAKTVILGQSVSWGQSHYHDVDTNVASEPTCLGFYENIKHVLTCCILSSLSLLSEAGNRGRKVSDGPRVEGRQRGERAAGARSDMFITTG